MHVTQTELRIADSSLLLADDENVEDVKSRLSDTFALPGSCMNFAATGNRPVSILVTPRTCAQFVAKRVPVDAGDIVYAVPSHQDWDLL